MAIFNEILVGRFNKALQKITGIKGGAAVKQLGSEILPTFPMFWGNENRYLESWQMFGVSFDVGPFGAGTSVLRVINPAGSNIVAVFTKLAIFSNSAVSVQYSLEGPTPSAGALPTDISTFPTRFDARGQQNTGLKLSESAGAVVAGVGNTNFTLFVSNSNNYEFLQDTMQEFPLLPGDQWQLRQPVVNQRLTGGVWWRERYLEDQERF